MENVMVWEHEALKALKTIERDDEGLGPRDDIKKIVELTEDLKDITYWTGLKLLDFKMTLVAFVDQEGETSEKGAKAVNIMVKVKLLEKSVTCFELKDSWDMTQEDNRAKANVKSVLAHLDYAYLVMQADSIHLKALETSFNIMVNGCCCRHHA